SEIVQGDQAGRIQEARAVGEDSRVGSAEAASRALATQLRTAMARDVTDKTSMLARFHPLVRKWFKKSFGEPSPPQRQGWPAIASGAHTLILAPTGTGKTLAAFLWELNQLITEGARKPLANAVQILYISPL